MMLAASIAVVSVAFIAVKNGAVRTSASRPMVTVPMYVTKLLYGVIAFEKAVSADCRVVVAEVTSIGDDDVSYTFCAAAIASDKVDFADVMYGLTFVTASLRLVALFISASNVAFIPSILSLFTVICLVRVVPPKAALTVIVASAETA